MWNADGIELIVKIRDRREERWIGIGIHLL
jgi:hypothetical protein